MEMDANLCPECGANRTLVKSMLQEPTQSDNYQIAIKIVGNCAECRKAIIIPLRFDCVLCNEYFPKFNDLMDHYNEKHRPKFDLHTQKQLDDLQAMREAKQGVG